MAVSTKNNAILLAEFCKAIHFQIEAKATYPELGYADSNLPFMTAAADAGVPIYDNFPWNGPTNFNTGGKPTYYYLSEPSKMDLQTVARKTPFGMRLTYGMGKDVFNNNFSFSFPNNPDLKASEVKMINEEIRTELVKIGLYRECWKWYSYNLEQGRAALVLLHKGDGVKELGLHELSDPKYGELATEYHGDEDVIRVQAINYFDYQVQQITSFGDTKLFNINFWHGMNQYQSFYVHPSRVVEMKTNEIDLDQFKGQSALKGAFGQISILTQLYNDVGDALHRWGHGWPWFKFKGLRNPADWRKAVDAVGNPHSKSYFVSGSELEDIKMMGVQQTQMNVYEIFDMLVESICVSAGIPKVIMMGSQVGVTQAGAVMERTYFQTLSKEQNAINYFLYQLFALIPQIQRIFKKYHIESYHIVWGLFQALTEMEQADLDLRKYTNANAAAMYATWEEVRQMMGLPSFKDYFASIEGGEELCMSIYGITPAQLDITSPRAGEFRQRFLQEVLQSPEEQEAEESESNVQMLGEQNNVENKARSEGTSSPTNGASSAENKKVEYAKENQRRENKALRADQQIADLEKELLLVKASLIAQHETFGDKAEEGLKMIQQLRSQSEMQDDALSWNKLAEEMGIARSSLQSFYDKLQVVYNSKRKK